jgi:hypothetical protein
VPVLEGRRHAPPAVVAAVLVVAAAGCSGGDDGTAPEPAPPRPPAFDCEAVARAGADLDARGAAELERLGLAADDPRALTVTVVAAGTGAPAYWSAVRAALTDGAPASVRSDVELVDGYWAALAPRLATVTVPDARPETVRAAGQQLTAVAAGAPDDALAPAQDRVEDAVRADCG